MGAVNNLLQEGFSSRCSSKPVAEDSPSDGLMLSGLSLLQTWQDLLTWTCTYCLQLSSQCKKVLLDIRG